MPENPKSAESPPIASAEVATEPQKVADALDDDALDNAEHPSLPKIVPFTDLARCGDEIWISHQGQLYRLQCTKAGKLILTK